MWPKLKTLLILDLELDFLFKKTCPLVLMNNVKIILGSKTKIQAIKAQRKIYSLKKWVYLSAIFTFLTGSNPILKKTLQLYGKYVHNQSKTKRQFVEIADHSEQSI